METEVWKDVIGYEGFYQVSNFGRVKSLDRIIVRSDGQSQPVKEKIKDLKDDGRGYLQVGLCSNNYCRSKKVHRLVALAFLNANACGMEVVVNHIDGDKKNNNLRNLELVSQRQNTSMYQDKKKTSSIHTGVSWCKANKKWSAIIKIKGRGKYLGYFKNEIDAANAYQLALQTI